MPRTNWQELDQEQTTIALPARCQRAAFVVDNIIIRVPEPQWCLHSSTDLILRTYSNVLLIVRSTCVVAYHGCFDVVQSVNHLVGEQGGRIGFPISVAIEVSAVTVVNLRIPTNLESFRRN
jgi:hypothetical protein